MLYISVPSTTRFLYGRIDFAHINLHYQIFVPNLWVVLYTKHPIILDIFYEKTPNDFISIYHDIAFQQLIISYCLELNHPDHEIFHNYKP